jgi:hypothetical protein
MGFAYQGYCYQDAPKANEAFQQTFPLIDVNITYLVSSSITGSGLITYNLLTRPMTSNTLSSRTGTLQLSSCTESLGIQPSPFVMTQSDALSVGVAIATLWLVVGVLKHLSARHFS